MCRILDGVSCPFHISNTKHNTPPMVITMNSTRGPPRLYTLLLCGISFLSGYMLNHRACFSIQAGCIEASPCRVPNATMTETTTSEEHTLPFQRSTRLGSCSHGESTGFSRHYRYRISTGFLVGRSSRHDPIPLSQSFATSYIDQHYHPHSHIDSPSKLRYLACGNLSPRKSTQATTMPRSGSGSNLASCAEMGSESTKLQFGNGRS